MIGVSLVVEPSKIMFLIYNMLYPTGEHNLILHSCHTSPENKILLKWGSPKVWGVPLKGFYRYGYIGCCD